MVKNKPRKKEPANSKVPRKMGSLHPFTV